ncbi:MAG: hypothetical protein AAFX50_01210 [Acidobacteriota bacterium]
MARELYSDCSQCGAAMRYAPGSCEMACDHCGHRVEIDVAEGEEVRLFDFEAALEDPELLRPFSEVFPDGHEVECERCGSHTVLEGQADHCPHCGGPVLHEVPADDLISPDSILLFVVDREAAEADFDEWLRASQLPTAEHAAVLQSAAFDGVYLPHWSFTWRSTIFYSGQSGDQSPWFNDRISWTQTGGAVRHEFRDVLANASRRSLLDPPHWDPWDSNDLIPFDPSFLLGFQARRYDRDLRAAFQEALGAQSDSIRSSVRSDIPGEHAKVESTEVIHENIRFRHSLLPAWIVHYRHGGEEHRALMDGETGQVYGDRPPAPDLGPVAGLLGVTRSMLPVSTTKLPEGVAVPGASLAAAIRHSVTSVLPSPVRNVLKVASVPAALYGLLYFLS